MPTFTISRVPPSSAVEFPSAELCFSADGATLHPENLGIIRSELATAGVTDLLVLCGGWSTRDADLRALYDGLTATARSAVRRDAAYSAHTYGVLRVLWPARRWAESPLNLSTASLSANERDHRNVAALEMEVTSLRGAFSGRQADRHLLKVWQLIGTVSESVPAQVSLVEHVRELVRGTDEMNPSPKPDEYASRRFLTMHPVRLLEALSDPIGGEPGSGSPNIPAAGEGNDAPSSATSLALECDIYQGIRNLLRYAVCTELRARAEAVGRLGLRESLLTLSRGLPQTRFHLIGHSFGARALLSAVDAPPDSAKLLRPKSMTLLQPALPEDAFAPPVADAPEGIFHQVLAEGKVGGPILVSYSISDETADIPYAIARRIAAHSQPGKHNYPDPVRAMAQNGAAQTGAHQLSLSSRSLPRWRRGMVVNLNGYGLIGEHNDVCKVELVRTMLSAATTTT